MSRSKYSYAFVLFLLINIFYTIRTEAQALRILPQYKKAFHIPFKIVEVQDARDVPNQVMVYRTGFDRAAMSQNFITLFDADFQEYIDYTYEQQDTVQIRLVLTSMKLSARNEQGNLSSQANANFDFYRKIGDEWKLLYQIKPSTSSAGLEEHRENIVFLLETAIDRFYENQYPDLYKETHKNHFSNIFFYLNYGIGAYDKQLFGVSLMYPLDQEFLSKNKFYLDLSVSYLNLYKSHPTFHNYSDIQGGFHFVKMWKLNDYARLTAGVGAGFSSYYYELNDYHVTSPNDNSWYVKKMTLFLSAKEQLLLVSNSRFQAALGLYQNYHPTRIEDPLDAGLLVSIVWSRSMKRSEK